MKKLLKIFVYVIVFILSMIIFLPKESLYNLVEKQLEKEHLIISNEKRDENLLGLTINDANIYYQDIKIANVEKNSISTYLFYTNINIENIRLLDSLKTMIPSPISNINISHSIFEYDKLNIIGNGSFGDISGFVDIVNRVIFLELNASNKMKTSYSKILMNMKLKDGRYIYEYKF